MIEQLSGMDLRFEGSHEERVEYFIDLLNTMLHPTHIDRELLRVELMATNHDFLNYVAISPGRETRFEHRWSEYVAQYLRTDGVATIRQQLVAAFEVMPIGSVPCEQVFSLRSAVKTTLRSSMHTDLLNAYIRLKCTVFTDDGLYDFYEAAIEIFLRMKAEMNANRRKRDAERPEPVKKPRVEDDDDSDN